MTTTSDSKSVIRAALWVVGFWLSAALALALVLGLFTAMRGCHAQDIQVYPATRSARVSKMVEPLRDGQMIGPGYRIVLAFEDSLEPQRFTLTVSKSLFDRTLVGDLFVCYYEPDGDFIKFQGPIKENNGK